MKINQIETLFEIERIELDSWSKRPHKNNFFEIVYIQSGVGVQCINGNLFEYHSGNIFLLPPLNCHSFEIKEHSIFYFVRFSDSLFGEDGSSVEQELWFDNISHILANYTRVPGDIIASESQRKYIVSSIEMLYGEREISDGYIKDVTVGVIGSILNILARSIEERFVDGICGVDGRFGSILRYINMNITDNSKLRIPHLAERFAVSKGYFSDYFKREAGVNLAEYIIKAKLRLAETYILHTDQGLKEIAHRLNFTDSSHLSNSFKRFYGLTIGEFRSIDGQQWRQA